MEPIVCHVRNIETRERDALERVVGQPLHDSQMLIIQISEVGSESAISNGHAQQVQTLSDWTNVYEGLSGAQIDAIDNIIKSRAKLTRHVP
jgi:hypothetical protein